jgi:DNA-binding GntR family transcriptional regulator
MDKLKNVYLNKDEKKFRISESLVKTRVTKVAYDVLEEMIATLKLQPGQIIVESDLILQTGLGRTPIREALMRFVASGLIEQLPRRGLRVGEIRIAAHLTLIDTRRVLEMLISSGAAKHANPGQRESMLACASQMTLAAAKGEIDGYMKADQNLDHVIHDSCRNPFAVQAVLPLIVQCRRFWYAYQYEGDLEQGAYCHSLLANGIATGDRSQAMFGANALMDYLESFTRKVIE